MKVLKFTFLFLSLGLFVTNASAVNSAKNKIKKQNLSEVVEGMDYEQFLNLTPKKYKKLTGKKMGFKNAVKLKMAQTSAKAVSSGAVLPKGVYILLAIFSLGWLAMGLNDDFQGDNWWIGLLLYLLLWLPGFIFTLIKMKDYY